MQIKVFLPFIFLLLTFSFSGAAQIKDSVPADRFDHKKERSKTKYNFIPLPSFDPSTKFGLNLMNMFTYYPDKEDMISPPSSGGFGGQVTSNGSWMLGAGNTLYLNEDRWRLTGQFFYGQINQKLDLGFPSITDAKRIISALNLQALRQVYNKLYFGFGYSYRKVKYEGRDANSQKHLEALDLANGEGNHGVRYMLTFDKRDNVNFPYKGLYLAWRSEQYFEGETATAYFAHYLDYRHFFNVTKNNPGQQVFAYRIIGRFLTGDPQGQNFTYYGRTGGYIERGYETGKYIDRDMVNMEAEYRIQTSALKNKLGLTAITGIGKVYGEYQDFTEAEWLPMVGIGARYELLPYERMNIRFDVTHGKEGFVLYFGVREAF